MPRNNNNNNRSRAAKFKTHITLHGHANFNVEGQHWSSHQAALTFRVWLANDEAQIRVVKRYTQDSASNPQLSAMPFFKPKEMERLEKLALKKFAKRLEEFKEKRRAGEAVKLPWIAFVDDEEYVRQPDKEHKMDLCERCKELGYNCTGSNVIEVLEGVRCIVRDQKKYKERKDRLVRKGVTKLYHQTSPDAAKLILESQCMKRGDAGSLGGGIYFATSIEATDRKALQRGVVLECDVLLGNICRVDRPQQLNFVTLLNSGHDSVVCGAFASGDEYVVYNWDQVIAIRAVRPQPEARRRRQ